MFAKLQELSDVLPISMLLSLYNRMVFTLSSQVSFKQKQIYICLGSVDFLIINSRFAWYCMEYKFKELSCNRIKTLSSFLAVYISNCGSERDVSCLPRPTHHLFVSNILSAATPMKLKKCALGWRTFIFKSLGCCHCRWTIFLSESKWFSTDFDFLPE